VLDGKKNKTVGVCLKKRYRGKASFVFVSLVPIGELLQDVLQKATHYWIECKG
jgi:hypothetical protein